jgi:small subunit ribosomal protein S16
MLMIRLARAGSKKRPFYHLVATDKRSARDGRYIERLGFFNPIAAGQEEKMRINRARISELVQVGAQLSQRVDTLLKEWDKIVTVAA